MTLPILARPTVISAACPTWVAESLRLIAEQENLSTSALLADVSREYVTARGYSAKEIEKILFLGVTEVDCSK